MKTIWVLVADEAIARILRWPENGGQLEPVEELTDADAHASGTDLRRDAYGRRSGSATHQARQDTPHRLQAVSSVTSSAGEAEQHVEAGQFAAHVAEHLGKAVQQKRFDELRIAAAPRFLGALRKALPPQVASLVTTELNKDLVHAQNDELTQRFFGEKTA